MLFLVDKLGKGTEISLAAMKGLNFGQHQLDSLSSALTVTYFELTLNRYITRWLVAGEGGRGQDFGAEGRGGEADPGDAGGQPRVARHLAAGGVQAVSRR